jgi:hypothetical protein
MTTTVRCTLAAAGSQNPLFFSGAGDGIIKAWAPSAVRFQAQDNGRGQGGLDAGDLKTKVINVLEIQ